MSSKIEWTEQTWNPVVGCTPVSEGCRNCWAAKFAAGHEAMGTYQYIGTTLDGKFHGIVNCVPKALDIPLHWKKPQRIAVCLMGDLFHKDVPFGFIDKVFAVMALCPEHTFQLLTKRPERMVEYHLTRVPMDDSGRVDRAPQWYQVLTKWLDEGDAGRLAPHWSECHEAAASLCLQRPLRNVWLGTSVEDQVTADERIPHLLNCPAAVRFLSIEPMLEEIELTRVKCGTLEHVRYTKPVWINPLDNSVEHRLDWVILGGESGPGARPMNPDWVRSIRDQCVAAGVAFFFKQGGGVNKKKTGRVLDGRTWDEMPETAERKGRK